MYAYCGNNPVMRVDSTGKAWWNPFSWDWGAIGRAIGGSIIALAGAAFTIATLPVAISLPGGGFLTQTGLSTMMYGGFMVGSAFDSQIKSDMDAIGWNPFNMDESLVINAQKVSFYKGQSVIKGNFPGAASFGIMFVDKSSWVTSDTIRHEYGHFLQMGILGLPKFTLGIAIPSLIGTQVNKGHYESQLWERTADWFGGAMNGPYNKNSLLWALLYFAGILII